jgi:hypothetical protein
MESAVDPKQIVHHLLTTADKYRRFAQWIGDHETVRRILALTDELKQRARAMSRRKPTSEIAPGRSGKKMAAQPGGMKSFGSRPNVNFGKPRISQNETVMIARAAYLKLLKSPSRDMSAQTRIKRRLVWPCRPAERHLPAASFSFPQVRRFFPADR